jgi:hypothetical protein
MQSAPSIDLDVQDLVYQASKIEDVRVLAKRANVHERTALRLIGGLRTTRAASDALLRVAREVLGSSKTKRPAR